MPSKQPSRAWTVWAFIPWLGGISFIIAGIKAKERRWWILGLVLLVPTIPGFALSDSEGPDAFDVAVGFAVAAWAVAVACVLRIRPKYELRMAELHPEKHPAQPPRRVESPYGDDSARHPIPAPTPKPATPSTFARAAARPAATVRSVAPPESQPPPAPVTPAQTERELADAGLTRVLIDLNSATAAEMAELPGMTPVLAERALGYRAGRGGYRDFGDFVDAVGLQPHEAEKLRLCVTVRPAAPKPADRGRLLDL
jgi:DNA uptake protein ComE-like DNA-binding protein